MIGNYSLADQLTGVGLTPLGEDVLNDPRAMQRMGNDLAGMSAYQGQGEGPAIGYGTLFNEEPAGAAYGQQGSSFYTPTQEDDSNAVFDIFKTMIGAPFNILRGAKEGLEEIIGHPYAAERDAQEQYIMAMSALRDPDKALIGMPVDRTGINDRQTNPSTVATGTAGGTSANMQPVRSWLPDLITGEKRKRRQRELAQIEASLKAQGIKLNLESLQAGISKDYATGYNQYQQGEGHRLQNIDIPLNNETWRTNQLAQANEHNAGAYENMQQGYQAKARGDRTYFLMPGENEKNLSASRVNDARAGLLSAQTDQTNALTAPKQFSLMGSGAARVAQAQKTLSTTGVATGVDTKIQSATKQYNAAQNADERLAALKAWKVPYTENKLFPGQTPDWDAYRKQLESEGGETGTNDAVARLQELIDSLANFKPNTPTSTVPAADAPAAPATTRPTGTPETGQVSYEANQKAAPYRGLSKKAAFAALKADVEARKITEAEFYSIMAALGIERRR